MKQKKILSLALAVLLALALMPAAAFAAVDNEDVINSVEFTFGGKTTAVKPAGRVITLKVPHSFSDNEEVDLSTSLRVNYSESLFPSYTFQAEVFVGKSKIKADETAVLLANYKSSSGFYSSKYTVKIERSDEIESAFSGSVSVRVPLSDGQMRLSREMFAKLYSKNDGAAFGGVVISGADKDKVLFKKGSAFLDTSIAPKVNASELDSLYIIPQKAGNVSIRLYAFGSDGERVEGAGSLDIEITETASVGSYGISVTQFESASLSGVSTAFGNAAHEAPAKFKLNSSLSYGSLIYDYTNASDRGSVLSAGSYVNASDLSRLSYVPSRSLTRSEVEILKYTCMTSSGEEYTGSIQISIICSAAQLSDLKFSVKSDEVYGFDKLDFAGVYAERKSGELSRVEFVLPEISSGELCYNYADSNKKNMRVSEGTPYYAEGRGVNLISFVSFVPADDFTGSFYIYYIANNTGGTAPARGRIAVNVTSSKTDVIRAEVYEDEIFSFADIAYEMNSVFKDEDGKSFSYVSFVLPSKRYGTLFYNYESPKAPGTRVTEKDRYYRSGDTLLGNVSFIPAVGYEGSFDLKYDAYNAKGESYRGTVRMRVEDSDFDVKTLNYTVASATAFTLSSSDINEVVREESGNVNFDYITFTELPSSNKGNLYLGYTSPERPGERVIARKEYKYYRSGNSNSLVNKLTLVPFGDYGGSLELEYRAYVSRSEYYDGKIAVNVKDAGAKLGLITLSVKKGESVALSNVDFVNAIRKYTNKSLDYITLELPPAGAGSFYYNYSKSTGRYDFRVEEGDDFYLSGRGKDLIGSVSFVPRNDYIGSFTVAYGAFDEDGEREYIGSIKINVEGEFQFTDVSEKSVYYDAIKWAVENGIITGTSKKTFSPNAASSRGLIVLSMWHAAGDPEPKSLKNPFTDVSKNAPYFKAVLWAVENGITKGATATTFVPSRTVNRGESMTFLYRQAGEPTPRHVKNPFLDVPKDVFFHHAVSWSYENGITTGTSAKYYSPKESCTRAQIVTFLYRNEKLKKDAE